MSQQTVIDPKTPAEVKLYDFDWVDQLGLGTILTAVWTVPGGIVSVLEQVTLSRTFVLLSGGTVDTAYTLICTITTSAGETLQAAMQIRVMTAEHAAGISS